MGLNPLGANSMHAPFIVHPLPDSREGLVALVDSRFVRDGGITPPTPGDVNDHCRRCVATEERIHSHRFPS